MVLLFVFCFPVNAANIIDQDQPQYDLMPGTSWAMPMARFDQVTLAQSFQQANNNIAGAGILLSADGWSSQEITISIWDNLPNQVGANMLAFAYGTPTSVSTTDPSANWFNVFWTAVPVTPGVTYYLDFASASSLLGVGGTSNVYPYGQVYADVGVPYQSFPQYDYTFRTYYDDAYTPGPGPGPVPEPTSLLLLGLGLMGLAGVRRFRN